MHKGGFYPQRASYLAFPIHLRRGKIFKINKRWRENKWINSKLTFTRKKEEGAIDSYTITKHITLNDKDNAEWQSSDIRF